MRRHRHFVLASMLALSTGCEALVHDAPLRPSGTDEEDGVTADAPFALDRQQPQLLSYSARLRRVAAVIGRGVDDPALAPLRTDHIALGDYDHASGVLPDNSWNASRIMRWARALRSVCASAAMRERYPSMPESLPALIEAAWGRQATPEDLADFQAEVFDQSTDPNERYQVSCLAVLSAAEFVYQ